MTKIDSWFSWQNYKNIFRAVPSRKLSFDFFENIPYDNTDKLREEFSKLDLPDKQPRNDISLVDCCGDFQIAHKDLWNDIRGFEERLVYCLYTDTNVQK